MSKKYELTDETIEAAGRRLYRIRALRDAGIHPVLQPGGGAVRV